MIPDPSMHPERERGAVVAMLAAAVVLVLAFTGLAADGTRLLLARRDTQAVVDAAALAGASSLDEASFRASSGDAVHLDPVDARRAVLTVLRDSGVPADADVAVDVRDDAVAVHVERVLPWTFLRVLRLPPTRIGASATASPVTG